MKKNWKRFIKFFDTFPEIHSDECREILRDKQKTQELMIAIDNDQNHMNNKLPTRYKVYRVGVAI